MQLTRHRSTSLRDSGSAEGGNDPLDKRPRGGCQGPGRTVGATAVAIRVCQPEAGTSRFRRRPPCPGHGTGGYCRRPVPPTVHEGVGIFLGLLKGSRIATPPSTRAANSPCFVVCVVAPPDARPGGAAIPNVLPRAPESIEAGDHAPLPDRSVAVCPVLDERCLQRTSHKVLQIIPINEALEKVLRRPFLAMSRYVGVGQRRAPGADELRQFS